MHSTFISDDSNAPVEPRYQANSTNGRRICDHCSAIIDSCQVPYSRLVSNVVEGVRRSLTSLTLTLSTFQQFLKVDD
ncbi:hypothetical protein KCU65_g204, partial [Aureobasidium melanogenum]